MRRLALLPFALLLVASPAAAAADPAAGSWTQARRTTPLGSSPDLNPGLAVQNGPGGVVTFTAVRTAAVAAGAVLTLKLEGGGSTATPVVWACPATKVWTPGAGQSWDGRPTYDCKTHAIGTVAGTSVSWQLTPDLVAGTGRLDVALVPDPASTEPLSVSFAPPSATSFSLSTEEPAPSPAPPPAAPDQLAPPLAAAQSAPAPLLVGGGPVDIAPAPAALPPAVVALQGVPAQEQPPTVAAALAVASTPRSYRYAGAGLLALLALLLMARTALPSRPLSAPTSLLRRPEPDAQDL